MSTERTREGELTRKVKHVVYDKLIGPECSNVAAGVYVPFEQIFEVYQRVRDLCFHTLGIKHRHQFSMK